MGNNPWWIPPHPPVAGGPMRHAPNCKFNKDFTLVATEDIKKGDEFLVDYSFDKEEELECFNGTVVCHSGVRSRENNALTWESDALRRSIRYRNARNTYDGSNGF
jgi:SET domain-containing protein